MRRKRPLAIFAISYFAGLLLLASTPLFLDSVTLSYIDVVPLVFTVAVLAYLAIHNLRLRGILRLIALFIALEGLVTVSAGLFAPSGFGQATYATSNNTSSFPTNNLTTRWLANFGSKCILIHGDRVVSESSGYQLLGYGGVRSALNSDCYGFGQLSAQSLSSGLRGESTIQSSVWFMDQSFYVQNQGYKWADLVVSGSFWASGWVGRNAAGIGMYNGFSTLVVEVRLVGNAPCVLFYCNTSNYMVKSWTTPSSFSSEYQFSGDNFLVVPGYSYNIIVSFNETSNTYGYGAGGLTHVDTCIGYTSYCTSSSTSAAGSVSCSQDPSRWEPCGLALNALDYILTPTN